MRHLSRPSLVQELRTSPPKGIFILDSPAGTHRDANIRDLDWVTGYALRQSWADMEPTKGNYSFTVLDHIIGELNAIGQKLALDIFNITFEPTYLLSEPGVTLWNSNSRVVPWDPTIRARWKLFCQKLANHPTEAPDGSIVPFAQNPILAHLNVPVPGIGSIREVSGAGAPPEISSLPGYSRQNLIDAVRDALHAAADMFSTHAISVAFFPITDATSNPSLVSALDTAIATEFDGRRGPKIGYFEENLSASRSGATFTGRPLTSFATPLVAATSHSWVALQMTQSWLEPFQASQTEGTDPVEAMQYALDTYDCEYIEIYIQDADYGPYQTVLEAWAQERPTGGQMPIKSRGLWDFAQTSDQTTLSTQYGRSSSDVVLVTDEADRETETSLTQLEPPGDGSAQIIADFVGDETGETHKGHRIWLPDNITLPASPTAWMIARGFSGGHVLQYEEAGDYKLLIFHHGVGNDRSTSVSNGVTGTLTAIKSAITAGQIDPLIVLYPQGMDPDDTLNIDLWGNNAADGSYPFETMIIDELIPRMPLVTRAASGASNRAMWGFSRGGMVTGSYRAIYNTYCAAWVTMGSPRLTGDFPNTGSYFNTFSTNEKLKCFNNDQNVCVARSPITSTGLGLFDQHGNGTAPYRLVKSTGDTTTNNSMNQYNTRLTAKGVTFTQTDLTTPGHVLADYMTADAGATLAWIKSVAGW